MNESPKKINEIVNKLNLSIIVIIVLLIVIIIQSIALIYVHKKLDDPWVVGFEEGFGPIRAEVVHQDLKRLNNPGLFVERMLDYMYDWGENNFLEKKDKAKKYMTPNAKKQFNAMYGENFYQKIKEDEISSNLNIERSFKITKVNNKKYNNLFKQEIDGTKVKVVDYKREVYSVNITIYFRIVRVNENNEFGYEVVGFKEKVREKKKGAY